MKLYPDPAGLLQPIRKVSKKAMASVHYNNNSTSAAPSGSQSTEILDTLVSIASTAANAQIGVFTVRYIDALLQFSEHSFDPKESSLSFNVANLLKKNTYAYYYLLSVGLEKSLQQHALAIGNPSIAKQRDTEGELSLVSYEEVDKALSLSKVSRPIEVANEDEYGALGMRLGKLLGVDAITIAQNPFRPEVFIQACLQAWCEFAPDQESHYLMMQMLRPEMFIDVAPIIKALNDELIACGMLPDLGESFRIRKTTSVQDTAKKQTKDDVAVVQQLRNLFSPQQQEFGSNTAGGHAANNENPLPSGFQEHVLEAAAASSKLLTYLAGIQKSSFSHEMANGVLHEHAHARSVLPDIKAQAPQGTFNRFDENTIDLLTKVFDVVFRDQNIPQEIKSLIGFLQVPVLKTALVDKEFFFTAEHPARQVIELLSKSSVGWDQNNGEGDPLYQTIKRNVQKIQQDTSQQPTLFRDVIADLESFINQEESQAVEILAAPITQALRQEKIGQATNVAKNEVAVRINTGEVIPFVESFLEKKWVSVLTIAYSVKDEKPQAVASAVKTMDELIWSVKPKITVAERKEMIARLPPMLAALNKWLNVVKWDDADRLQFFADLAECHASIVRAPIEMSPQRQLEIAIEVAKNSAERRRNKRDTEQPVVVADEFVATVDKLERGVWLAFTQADGSSKKVKLAWVSPLRTLFIFSTLQKTEAFSLPAEELTQIFRDQRVQTVELGGLVDRALAEAMASTGANDSTMEMQSAA